MPSNSLKLAAGSTLPALTLAVVAGGECDLAAPGCWRMIVVYRGKHCPLCRQYLDQLQAMLDDFSGLEVDVVAISADPRDKAAAQVEEQGLSFPVGYGLDVPRMFSLGLYVSAPRSPEETDRPFAEPGLFVLNPEGRLQIIDVSNAPFSRPALKDVLDGLKFIQGKDYPIRGTLDEPQAPPDQQDA